MQLLNASVKARTQCGVKRSGDGTAVQFSPYKEKLDLLFCFFSSCLFVIVGELNETEKVELLVNLHLILATGAMIIPTAMVYLSFTKPVLVHVLLKQAPSAPWETSATKWSGTGNPHSMAPSAWGY